MGAAYSNAGCLVLSNPVSITATASARPDTGAAPASAEIMIRDADVHHMLRDRKTRPLPRAWLRELPTHLRSPSAVLMDHTHDQPALILIFDAP